MKDFFATVVGSFLAVVIVVAVVIGVSEGSYQLYRHYAPLQEQVRRETYEQSRAFREGTIHDLENMQMEYARGNDAQKAAIRSVALHRLADIPDDLLTNDLVNFRHELESAQ